MTKSKKQTESIETTETTETVSSSTEINSEYYNAYKEIFQYIYPKVDINVWTPEIMEKIILISNDI